MAPRSISAGAAVAALVLALLPPATAAQSIEPLAATDPRAVVADSVVRLLLGGQRASVEAYLSARATPEYLHSENFAGSLTAALAAVSRPGLQIADHARGLDHDVLVRVEPTSSRGSPVFVAVGVEPAPPHRVVALRLPNIMMGPPPGSAPLERVERAEREELVEALAAALEDTYVAADTGKIIADHIRRQHRAGAFDTISGLRDFAAALTRAMRSVHPDLHLAVMAPAVMGGRMQASSADAERLANYFMPRVEVLEGNIGYLRVSSLSPQPAALERLGHALTFLQDTDALIIDLRGVRGGSAAMSNAIISHFLPPALPTLSVWSRQTQQTTTTRTLDAVPGPRRLEVPLYILVDEGAGSAAEHVPFVLQNLGRATIVGARTAGAGRNNVMRSLPFGFAASISNTFVRDPASGREWERAGVTPDVATPSDEALDTAVQHARSRLGRPQQGT